MILPTAGTSKSQFIGTDGNMVAVRGWGRGELGELLFNRQIVSALQDDRVLEIVASPGAYS